MAGDWIKMRCDLADDPAVIELSESLKISEDEVIGKLYRLWSWANRQLRDGNARVTLLYVDKLVSVTGFAHTLEKVGWIRETKDGISFPNWDRHNSQSAKARALTLKRVRNARSVTSPLPEKRREEKSKEIKKKRTIEEAFDELHRHRAMVAVPQPPAH